MHDLWVASTSSRHAVVARLAFAVVAGFTAVAVVIVFDARAEGAFRTPRAGVRRRQRRRRLRNIEAGEHARGVARPDARPRRQAVTSRSSCSTGTADYSRHDASDGVNWSSVPDRQDALHAPLTRGRYISGLSDGSEFVVGVRRLRWARTRGRRVFAPTRGAGPAQLRPPRVPAVGHCRVRGGAALGLLIATLIARRLTRIARRGEGDRSGRFRRRDEESFPRRGRQSCLSIDGMREQLESSSSGWRTSAIVSSRSSTGSVTVCCSSTAISASSSRTAARASCSALATASRAATTSAEDGPRKLRAVRASISSGRTRQPSSQLDRRDANARCLRDPTRSDGENAIIVVADESERERNARVQREFATNAAHELRTPLASIVTAVEMLRTGAKDEPTLATGSST